MSRRPIEFELLLCISRWSMTTKSSTLHEKMPRLFFVLNPALIQTTRRYHVTFSKNLHKMWHSKCLTFLSTIILIANLLITTFLIVVKLWKSIQNTIFCMQTHHNIVSPSYSFTVILLFSKNLLPHNNNRTSSHTSCCYFFITGKYSSLHPT